MSQSPKEWFDQFPAAPDWPEESQWCARHWAPAAILGANGIGAAVEVMQAIVDGMPRSAKTVTSRNRELSRIGKLCCSLGDARMYEIWGHWPPKPEGSKG